MRINVAKGQSVVWLIAQMVLIVDCQPIANGGLLASPHLGLSVLDGSRVVERLGPDAETRVMTAEVARAMRDV